MCRPRLQWKMELLSSIKHFFIMLKNVTQLLCAEALGRLTHTEAKSVHGDIILITGGGKGIGKQIALQFALHRPAHIILWGRTVANLEETAKAIRKLDVNCSFMLCDVANKENIYSCAQEVKAKFGKVSILVNNAGVVIGNSILDADPNDIEYTFSVNTFAHVWTVKAFLPDMFQNNRGHIVIINSVLGLFGLKGASDYVSSKFASAGLAEALRQELQAFGKQVYVSSIHAYLVDNDMFRGMKTRISFLLPPLSERYVAERTVEAVLYNRNQILLPRIMYLVNFFNSIMPVTVSAIVNRALGADRAMDNVKKPPREKTTVTAVGSKWPEALVTMNHYVQSSPISSTRC